MGDLNPPENPFTVLTPEMMGAEDIYELFVPVPGSEKIQNPGHTLLNGPRGSGKSMIFRYLEPGCQLLQKDSSLEKLPFFGILVSIKNTAPNLTEFHRLAQQHVEMILNEHVLAVFVATKVFASIVSVLEKSTLKSGSDKPAVEFFHDSFIRRLKECGGQGMSDLPSDANVVSVFSHCKKVCDSLYQHVNNYAKRLSFPGNDVVHYENALCDYLGFLYPLLVDLRQLPFMPNCSFYLLIDDADNLSLPQTMVLNSWVATRTGGDVSIKISTQLRYKTYTTVSGPPIQTPHDYQEINVADVYTTRRSAYAQNIEAIIQKRFEKVNIDSTPKDFFPPNEKQEKAIKKIGEKIRADYPQSGRGYRDSDDVTRYARPEYIKKLGGSSKQTSSYSYAGFEQLVHISSGLVRFFLEPAAQMYAEESTLVGNGPVRSIRPKIQDQVIRKAAENLMFSEFDKLREDSKDRIESLPTSTMGGNQRKTEQLQNLIRALGGTFYQKLVSNDSERRVFSVAISGVPNPEVLEVFELGVQYGYFHPSSIGNKDGTGRTRLYVLTRRLAPHFKLDPSSFAGYLWVSNELLREGMENPEKLLRKVRRSKATNIDTGQLPLFQSTEGAP